MADQQTDTLSPDAETAADEIQDLLAEDLEASSEAEAPEYELRVTADKVTVVLDCPDPLSDLENWVARIIADFGKLEIPVHPDPEQMTSILRNICRPGRHLREVPIMMGQKAVPSRDGKLEWTRDFFSEGWAVDEETGAIDFWEKLENCAVHQDELLVTLLHPVEGDSGLNVFGIEIPVTKPSKVKLRCGKGVRTVETEAGVEYHAAVDGRVRFTDGTVSVDDVYVIKGNVSLATGNIRHSGAVQIQGDVETGATIDADGDVMIKGMVDPCDIRCGGTLTVAGGMVGSDDHTVQVDGDFNARYINEAQITVGGNVTVTNEISHSRILCRGKVIVSKGRIAGGQVQAYKGIRVAEAGASGSSDTTLIAGVDYAMVEILAKHKARIGKLEEAQEKVAAALRGLNARKDSLTPEEQKSRQDLAEKSRQLGQAIADEHTTVKRLQHEEKLQAVCEVVMYEEVWSGTRIQLSEFKTVVRASIQKPRIAQLRQTRVRILPLGEGNMPKD
jgi:uncharacterized protein (DUF342 family)